MGSSLEAAISFSAILLLVTFLIVAPIDICADSLNMANDGNWEIEQNLNCTKIIQEFRNGRKHTVATTPEILNTFLVGASENYWLIYGCFAGGSEDAEG